MKTVLLYCSVSIIALFTSCTSTKSVKLTADLIKTAGTISPLSGPPVKPSAAALKKENDEFVAKLRTYAMENKKWRESSAAKSTTFQIVGTIVGLAGGIVGLSTGNDIAAYTSLVVAANTGVMSILQTDNNLAKSGGCTDFLSETIRIWDTKSLPNDQAGYLTYVQEKLDIVNKLNTLGCKGF